MEEKKYPNQQKHLQENYERFPLNLRKGIKERFQATCKKNGTSAMAELQKFVDTYLEKHEKK